MKKIISIILIVCTFILTACGNSKSLTKDDYMGWGGYYMLACKIGDDPKNYSSSLYYLYYEEGETRLVATDMTERLVNLINYYAYDNLNFEDGDN
ncbi:MAG: hypothetical protein WC900_03185, partial [Oscillospiraceae bacterium]